MKILASILLAGLLLGCSTTETTKALLSEAPEINPETQTGRILRSLPPASKRAVVAVYDFEDQTGQHKPNDRIAEFSRAVTQGGAAILNQALVKAGEGTWFTVIERKGLSNLLKERQIISATREMYTGKKSKLPPMLYAGVILEGAIVSYESNTTTGGLGARYLGIGGNSEYRQDVVSIYLRAVNVKNGEILVSVDTSKTIFSTAVQGSMFKYVAFDEILELESGFTVNEPPQMAVRQAVESGVYALVMEGARKGLWTFANETAGRLAMQRYLARINDEPMPSIKDVAPVIMARPGDGIDSTLRKPIPQRQPIPMVQPRQPLPIPQPPAIAHMPEQLPQAIQQQPRPLPQISPNATPRRYTPSKVSKAPSSPTFNTARSQIPVNPAQRGTSNTSQLHRPRVGGDPTQVYCTSAGCFPFPPNGR